MKTANGFEIVDRVSLPFQAEMKPDSTQKMHDVSQKCYSRPAGMMTKFAHFVEVWRGQESVREWRAFFCRPGQEETGPYFVRRSDNFALVEIEKAR